MSRLSSSRRLLVALLGLALPAVILASWSAREVPAASSPATAEAPGLHPAGAAEVPAPPKARFQVDPKALGHSERLRVLTGIAGRPLEAVRVEGPCAGKRWRDTDAGRVEMARCDGEILLAPMAAGVWTLEGTDLPKVLALRPRAEKAEGRLGPYHVGRYRPRPARYSEAYEPPDGFIEVTEENQDLKVSDHFRLRHFLTKDQHDVWPKYLVLDLRLIDKLELVLAELSAMGHEAPGLFVMSGYRTPQYNGPGGGGRSGFSRHIYGDAADVWLDAKGDGRMDDLNGDGRIDRQDGRVILEAVERVEARHPDLVGGVGLYGWRGQRGPFVHIDARGRRARW